MDLGKLDSGQGNAGIIKTIFVSMILIVVMGWVVSVTATSITTSYTDHHYAQTDSTFDENIENSALSAWSTSAADNMAVEWDSSNHWVNVIDDPAGSSGLSGEVTTVSQTINVAYLDELNSASAGYAWKVATADNLTSATIKVRLTDPSSTTTLLYDNGSISSTTGWHSIENNVENLVNETGTYKLTLETAMSTDDNDVIHEINWDNASIDVDSKEKNNALGVLKAINTYGPTIVNILFIGLFILGVAALIRYLRA